MIQLNDIILALTNEEISPLNVKISSVVIDSREARSGSLFIALPGENVNGHDFVQAAFEKGAVLAWSIGTWVQISTFWTCGPAKPCPRRKKSPSRFVYRWKMRSLHCKKSQPTGAASMTCV